MGFNSGFKGLKYAAMGNCEIIVHLLVIVGNNKRYTVRVLKKIDAGYFCVL